MRKELDEKLCAEFPEIFADRHGNMKETAMCWGFECGDGWYTLIHTLCVLIANHVKHNGCPSVVATQVKEKYGTLRFYFYGGDERTQAYVTFAEVMSAHTCEVCGDPGITRGGYWLRTLCDKHYDSPQEEIK